ncbi:MAG: hypothetical protein ABEJ82_03600 [Haloplanus sp.]
MRADAERTVALVAIGLLVLSSVVVWGVAGERDRMAREARADAVAAQVTARQAPADYDGDGIVDARDDCPTRPETRNGFRDDDGCPDVAATTGAS